MGGSWVCIEMCRQVVNVGAAGPVLRCVNNGLTWGQLGLYQDMLTMG